MLRDRTPGSGDDVPMRTIALVALLGIALPCAHARDFDDPDGIPGIDDLEALPVPEYRYILIRLENEAVFRKLEELGERWRDLGEQLEEKPGNAWLEARRSDIRGEIEEVSWKAYHLFDKQRVTISHWVSARNTTPGPTRYRRAAHRLLRNVFNTGTASDKLFTQLTKAVDQAQARLADGLEQDDEDPTDEGRARRERAEERIEQVERRLWLVADWLVPGEKMARIRGSLPMHFQNWDDPLEHARLLPGLGVGTINRIRALGAAIEAQAAPDEALIQANERIVDDESKPDEERRKAKQAIRGAEKRLAESQVDLFARLRRILGDEGWKKLQAIPPRLDPGTRMEDPGEILGQIAFTDEQKKSLVPRAKRYRELCEKTERAMEALERERAGQGADSPQMEMMEMREATLEARMGEHARAILKEVFLELNPQQAVDWVLGAKP